MAFRKSTLLYGAFGLVLLLLFVGACLFVLNPEYRNAWRTADWEIPASMMRTREEASFDTLSNPFHSTENPKDPRFTIAEVKVEDLPSETDPGHGEIRIELEKNNERLEVSHDVVQLRPPHYEAKLDDGTVRLEAYALRLMPMPEEETSRHWRTPSGADLDETIYEQFELKHREYHRDINGAGTEIGLLFSSDFEHPIQWRASGFHDATTKANPTSSFSWSNDQEGLFIETVFNSLHDVTLRVFATIAHGDPQIHPMSPEPRATVTTPEFEAELLAIKNGSIVRQSSNYSSGSYLHTSSYKPGRRSFGLFRITPSQQGEQLAVAIEGTSGEREILKSHFHGNSRLTRINFPVPIEEIASIELIWLPKRTRLIVDIPIPALIPENRGVTDLLDVRIPATRFQRLYDLEEFLRRATQFAMISNPSSPIDHHFPLETEEQTVRELLLQLETLSPGDEVRILRDQAQINYGQIQNQTVWEQIKQWLRW